jgi:hypothetical protein
MLPSRGSARTGAVAALLFCGCGPAWIASAAASAAEQHGAGEEAWIQLFNGRDLTGWTPKIAGHELGDNYADTFRVQDGVLTVSYDGYQRFDSRFGHLFYHAPFSYYRLVIEYRFIGEQAPGDPGDWAVRNSGVMIHAQHPATMGLDQSFPVSIEAQFLGGLGDGVARPTANVCTPGTEIVHAGRIHSQHCLSSSSATHDGDGWVQVEVTALGAGQITHRVDGETVLTYALPQIGGEGSEGLAEHRGQLLDGGYIALQSESHPIQFRKVELLDLQGCMDPEASSYRPCYLKSQPEACTYAIGRQAEDNHRER